MISDEQRSKEILLRFKDGEPLNLSVVEIECPWLLERLFDADHFRGWRECIELAGVPIGKIRIEPLAGVSCRECGFEGDTLWSHLAHAHGMTVEDYRNTYPGAETSSEARRAEMMSQRHGRPAKAIIPHWEPAWSRNYALDRIHEFSRQGIPLNYAHVAKNEPGFAGYVRRIFQSWDAGLEAAGVSVAETRQAKEATQLNAGQTVDQLQRMEREKPARLHIRSAWTTGSKVVIRAAFRHFGSYEKALVAAGIDPLRKLPALGDSAKIKARDTLLGEALDRLRERPPYDPAEAKAFIDRHSGAIRDFYGNWANFATSLEILERDLFNPPGHLAYDSKEACIAALQMRAKVGLSLRQGDVRTDNPSLEIMGQKHFGTHSQALKAANVRRLPRNYDRRAYRDADAVISEIRHRHKNKESLFHSVILRRDGDRQLIKWSERYFGSYPKAIAAAGVPDPGAKPRSDKGIPKKSPARPEGLP